MWQKTYGGGSNDEGYSIHQMNDGNILSVGYSWSFGNAQEIYVVKSDLSGRKLWQKTYGGIHRDIGYKAISTNDLKDLPANEVYLNIKDKLDSIN